MCEFHDSSGKGFGDIWWTDNPIYFSSIDDCALPLGLRTQQDADRFRRDLKTHLFNEPLTLRTLVIHKWIRTAIVNRTVYGVCFS